MKNLIYFLAVLVFSDNSLCDSYKPIVLWHGMGDSCCFPFSLGGFTKLLTEELLPGVSVHSLRIGSCVPDDVENGFFMSPNRQVAKACELIRNDPNLKDGYNAIGFSQGGQFLRAVAQRCPEPRMEVLVTLGAQHQGVFGVPYCPAHSHQTCEYFRKLLNHAAYSKWVQESLVQATYWHDPLNELEYHKHSLFLADINNEQEYNSTYKDNLMLLEKFVMVKFTYDTMVQPIETEWFGFYKPGQDVEIVPLLNSSLYKKDKLGLKQMDEQDKLVFLEAPGNHLKFTKEWFVENIIPYLKGDL